MQFYIFVNLTKKMKMKIQIEICNYYNNHIYIFFLIS